MCTKNIAHEALCLEESLGIVTPQMHATLDRLIGDAVIRVRQVAPSDDAGDTATRTLRAIYEAFDADGVFMDRDWVTLLADGLTPRTAPGPSASAGQTLYYLDCDLRSVLYVAVAQELHLPVAIQSIPGHYYLHWRLADSPEAGVDWNPNNGKAQGFPSDLEAGVAAGIYRHDMSLGDIRAYWLRMVAQRWQDCDAQSSACGADNDGRFIDRAVVRWRRAYEMTAASKSTFQIAAENDYAWGCVTSPVGACDAKVAVDLAAHATSRWARGMYLDTLAGALADAHRPEEAARVEERALRVGEIDPSTDGESQFRARTALYRLGLTYREMLKSHPEAASDTNRFNERTYWAPRPPDR